MKQRVKMWGNSLSLRIPRAIAEELRLQPDSEVELSLEESKLVIRPINDESYDLDQLLSRVTPSNLHSETDWGEAVGREPW